MNSYYETQCMYIFIFIYNNIYIRYYLHLRNLRFETALNALKG